MAESFKSHMQYRHMYNPISELTGKLYLKFSRESFILTKHGSPALSNLADWSIDVAHTHTYSFISLPTLSQPNQQIQFGHSIKKCFQKKKYGVLT